MSTSRGGLDAHSKVGYGSKGAPTKHLWVGSVHPSVTDRELHDEFSRFGRVLDVKLLRSSHCAFVDFETADEAVRRNARTVGRPLDAVAHGRFQPGM